MLFICYSRCSTCKKAEDRLDAHKIRYVLRDIKEHNPSFEELSEWISKSGYPIKRFFNTSGMLYRDLQLKDKLDLMSEQEKIRLLATDGMLVKRPLVITDDFVLVGFNEKQWESLLK